MRHEDTEDFSEMSLLTNMEQLSTYELQNVDSKGCVRNDQSEWNQCLPIFCQAMDPVVDI